MTDREKLWNILKIILKTGITALLLYLVFRTIDIHVLKGLFLKSNFLYIALAFLLYAVSIIIGSWRSRGFLKCIGLELTTGFNFRLYLLGLFYNVTLPGGVGGDGYKVFILRKKYQFSTRRLLLAMLFDRLSGLWAISFIAVSLMLLIPKIDIPKVIPAIVFLFGTAIYYGVMRRYFRGYSTVFVPAHLKAVAIQSLQLVLIICLLLSQDFNGKFSPYLFSFLLSTLAANIPFVSIGGVGAREYTMTHASAYFGMDATLSVFLSVTFFIIATMSALSGVWFVYRSKEFEPMPAQEDPEKLKDIQMKLEK